MCWLMNLKCPEIDQIQMWLNTGPQKVAQGSFFHALGLLSSLLASFLAGSLLIATSTGPGIHSHSLTDTIKKIIILLLLPPPTKSFHIWYPQLCLTMSRSFVHLCSQGIYFNSIRTTWTENGIGIFPRNLDALPYENIDHAAKIIKCPLHIRKNIFVK